jgi:hypothetical protein
MLGQSFTPNVAGPGGSGSPGTSTESQLVSLVLGYLSSDPDQRAETCFLYSASLASEDDIGSPTNLVATSLSTADGAAFGAGSYSRTFGFNNESLSVSQKYYAYFSASQNANVNNTGPYAGGNMYDADMLPTTESAQFLVNMKT